MTVSRDHEPTIGSVTSAQSHLWRVARVGRNIRLFPANPESNAVLYPDNEEPDCYWTLIGCGSDEQQNALAQIIADALNSSAEQVAGDSSRDTQNPSDLLIEHKRRAF